MPDFISPSSLLRKKYEQRKTELVQVSPSPVSDICKHCWFASQCTIRTLTRNPPRSCCVYDFFSQRVDPPTLEEVVAHTCDRMCKSRQQWEYDPCVHDRNYCDKHCPVSKYIKDEPPSDAKDVPYDDYG